MIGLTTSLMLMLSAFSGANSASAAAVATAPVAVVQTVTSAAPSDSVEGVVRAYFADTPILAEVARCESTFAQFDKDGKVLRGRAVHSDVGVMQINEYYHAKTAEKMGLDIYTLEGNMAYAKYLYEKNGLSDWDASRPCWGKNMTQTLARK